jgi:hypothetical protein
MGRYLKDCEPIYAEDAKTYLKKLHIKDTKKYEMLEEKQIIAFTKEIQRNLSQYPFKKNKGKEYWYLLLAWYLGINFLENICYSNLKKIFLESEDIEEIGIYINQHIEQHLDWFEKK